MIKSIPFLLLVSVLNATPLLFEPFSQKVEQEYLYDGKDPHLKKMKILKTYGENKKKFEDRSFKIKSWKITSFSNVKKDYSTIKHFFKEDFDVACIQNVVSEEDLQKVNFNKNIIKPKNGFSWFVSNQYKNVSVLEYNGNEFENKPLFLKLSDVDIGIINFDSKIKINQLKDFRNNKDLKNENEYIENVYSYFSTKSGISKDRIISCGNFSSKMFEVSRNVKNKKVWVKQNTLVTEGLEYQNFGLLDTNHFITTDKIKGSATVDYNLLDYSNKSIKDFKSYVSEYFPISGKYVFDY